MFLLILRNLRYRRLRSYLTVLGVVIGAALILSLFFLGEGMKRAIAGQLQQFGSDLIYIFPGKEDNPLVGMFSGQTLRDKDVEIVNEVPGVAAAMAMNTATIKASFQGEEKSILLHGSPWRETNLLFTSSQGLRFAAGGWPTKDHLPEIVLGHHAAQGRFQSSIQLGDTMIVRGRRFEVKGVLQEVGDPASDAMVYMSLDRFRVVTGRRTGVNSAAVKVGLGYAPEEVAAEIKASLRRQKGIDNFVVLTAEKASNVIGGILSIVQIVVSAIAAVALLVGGVGILNSMYTAVLERTREVGVMKALGATARKILSLFLLESAVLGAVGGVLGVLLGGGAAQVAAFIMQRSGLVLMEVEFKPMIIIFVLAFASCLGALFGAWPAWRAARLKPTEALRYE